MKTGYFALISSRLMVIIAENVERCNDAKCEIFVSIMKIILVAKENRTALHEFAREVRLYDKTVCQPVLTILHTAGGDDGTVYHFPQPRFSRRAVLPSDGNCVSHGRMQMRPAGAAQRRHSAPRDGNPPRGRQGKAGQAAVGGAGLSGKAASACVAGRFCKARI